MKVNQVSRRLAELSALGLHLVVQFDSSLCYVTLFDGFDNSRGECVLSADVPDHVFWQAVRGLLEQQKTTSK